MGIQEKQFQFSRMWGQFLIWADGEGYQIQFGDGYRSTDKLYVPGGEEGFEDDDKYSYQELLFYNKKSKVTYGKHNDRLAEDILVYRQGIALNEEEYRPLGEKWESMGGRWGGRFGVKKEEQHIKVGWDSGHFELP